MGKFQINWTVVGAALVAILLSDWGPYIFDKVFFSPPPAEQDATTEDADEMDGDGASWVAA